MAYVLALGRRSVPRSHAKLRVPGPASLVVPTAVCGNDLEYWFDVAAVVACSAIVTGALLAAGLKTRGG